MIVCSCHAISDKAICRARDEGAHSVADIFRSLGVTPQCGKCVQQVAQLSGRQLVALRRRPSVRPCSGACFAEAAE